MYVARSNPFAASPTHLGRLTDDLLNSDDIPASASYSVHAVESLEAEALLALGVTASVFGGTFGNSPEILLAEYAEYLPSMLHILVCDTRTRTAIGSIGMIRTPSSSLKTVMDLESGPWGQPRTTTLTALGESAIAWDIATFAVLPAYRRTKAAIAMLHVGYAASLVRGTEVWTAILDDPVLRGVNTLTRQLFAPIGTVGSQPYLGSEGSTPVFARVPGLADADHSLSWVSGRDLEPTFAFVGRAREFRASLGLDVRPTA